MHGRECEMQASAQIYSSFDSSTLCDLLQTHAATKYVLTILSWRIRFSLLYDFDSHANASIRRETWMMIIVLKMYSDERTGGQMRNKRKKKKSVERSVGCRNGHIFFFYFQNEKRLPSSQLPPLPSPHASLYPTSMCGFSCYNLRWIITNNNKYSLFFILRFLFAHFMPTDTHSQTHTQSQPHDIVMQIWWWISEEKQKKSSQS